MATNDLNSGDTGHLEGNASDGPIDVRRNAAGTVIQPEWLGIVDNARVRSQEITKPIDTESVYRKTIESIKSPEDIPSVMRRILQLAAKEGYLPESVDNRIMDPTRNFKNLHKIIRASTLDPSKYEDRAVLDKMFQRLQPNIAEA